MERGGAGKKDKEASVNYLQDTKGKAKKQCQDTSTDKTEQYL